MHEFETLLRRLSEGRIGRRDFIKRATALGLAAAWVATRALGAVLHGLDAADVATWTAVTLLLSGAALVAIYVPARRVAGADPLDARVAADSQPKALGLRAVPDLFCEGRQSREEDGR